MRDLSGQFSICTHFESISRQYEMFLQSSMVYGPPNKRGCTQGQTTELGKSSIEVTLLL